MYNNPEKNLRLSAKSAVSPIRKTMKTKSIRIALLSFVSLLVGVANAAADHKYLKAFPKPAKGMARYVIELPHKDRSEENAFKVELIVGKMMLTDGVNHMFMGGKLETKPLKGWGFTYYQLDKFGPAGSTRIGVPPGTPKVEKFITASPAQLIRYNSRIPIVVYVPQGGEVHYRIWSTKPNILIAPEK